MFSFLDNIEDRTCRAQLRAAFDDGTAVDITDLQVYPRTGGVSFAMRELAKG